MNLNQIALLYGSGSIAGAMAITVLWASEKLFGQYVSFLLEINMNVETFYAPVFWGGCAGLLYMLPNKLSLRATSAFYGFIAAFAFLIQKFSWAEAFLKGNINLAHLLQVEVLATLIIFTFVWGYVTGKTTGSGGY